MEEEEAFGRIVKTKFFIAFFSGFMLLAGVATTFGITSTAFVMPIGGMGEFYVTFDRLEGRGFNLDSNLEDNQQEDVAPLVRSELEGATVYGLHIYKELNLPVFGWIRMNIESTEPTLIQGFVQEARFIEADVTFNNLGITQHDFNEMMVEHALWNQSADAISITDAKIMTDYLFQEIISLDGMTFSVERIDSPEQN